MTDDLLDDLRRADPVDRATLELPATLRARMLGAGGAGAPRPRPRGRVLRRLAPPCAAAVALAAVAAAMLLARGTTPDLAARAYAATSGHGIVHWRTDLLGYANGKLGSRQRTEGWSLGSVTHILRSDVVHRRAHLTVDERHVGRRVRTYMAGADDWLTITVPKHQPLALIPSGDPLVAFRQAYRAGRLRDLGGGRFEVPFKHMPAGSVIYDVDRDTGRPVRLTIRTDSPAMPGRPATRSTTVLRFSVYETLPATTANRARLALLPHPGAGPGTEPASQYFSVLRTGSAPAGAQGRRLREMAGHMSRFHLDPDGMRALRPGLWLAPGRGYLCLMVADGAGIGAGCQTIRLAARRGISTGNLKRSLVAVPDGVTGLRARKGGGRWRSFAIVHGVAELPGLGWSWRLIR